MFFSKYPIYGLALLAPTIHAPKVRPYKSLFLIKQNFKLLLFFQTLYCYLQKLLLYVYYTNLNQNSQ